MPLVTLPYKCMVLGREAASPSVPSHNVNGVLGATSAGLTFTPNDRKLYAPFIIPWDHIQEIGWGQIRPGGMDSALLAIPALFSWGLISDIYTVVYIKYWDEPYNTTSTVQFKIGGEHFGPRARDLVRLVWEHAAKYRSALKEAVKINLRQG